MSRIGKFFLISALCVTLNIPSSALAGYEYAAGAQTAPPSGAAMLVDGIIVRPLGIVATLIGGVVFVVTIPFSALGGNVGEAGQSLVVDPARMTFKRPLGEFD
jgi:hypothetical protein